MERCLYDGRTIRTFNDIKTELKTRDKGNVLYKEGIYICSEVWSEESSEMSLKSKSLSDKYRLD